MACPHVNSLLWPIPTTVLNTNEPDVAVPLFPALLHLDASNINDPTCTPTITAAFQRFVKRISTKGYHKNYRHIEPTPVTSTPPVSRLVVAVTAAGKGKAPSKPCSNKSLNPALLSTLERTDEDYTLQITITDQDTRVDLQSSHPVGILRGLVTLSQLVKWNPRTEHHQLQTCGTEMKIMDGPRFKWRGLMFDTARHYYSIDALKSVNNASCAKADHVQRNACSENWSEQATVAY